MEEKMENEKSHITLNIYNKQKDTNNSKGQSETSFQTNNSFTNTVEYFNSGICKEFPDNLRTEEDRKNYIPIKKEILTNKGFSKSVNIHNNNNYAQPEPIMQRPKIIMSNNNSDFSKEEYGEKCCCCKYSKKCCGITSLVIVLAVMAVFGIFVKN